MEKELLAVIVKRHDNDKISRQKTSENVLWTHKLGKMLMETFADRGWISKDKPTDKHFYITDKGQQKFTKLGLDLSQIKSEEL